MDQHPDPAAYWVALSPRRQAFDQAMQRLLFRGLEIATSHWLLLINSASFVLLILPTVIAPALLALGWTAPAQLIFWAYSSICHQMASRSFFVFGQQMAFCQRNTAIFGAFFLFGVVYILFRRRLKSLPDWLVVAYSLPMAVDGFTQLFGWRESAWELRLVTGALFGLTVVWYVFPHLELLMLLLGRQVREQQQTLARQGAP
ncbi:MAG: DUF2085 domain-containing protein [Chloroflexi bacterium]|nr:DUF2085 domain-containing protein [Chloroflexota bacterium]